MPQVLCWSPFGTASPVLSWDSGQVAGDSGSCTPKNNSYIGSLSSTATVEASLTNQLGFVHGAVEVQSCLFAYTSLRTALEWIVCNLGSDYLSVYCILVFSVLVLMEYTQLPCISSFFIQILMYNSGPSHMREIFSSYPPVRPLLPCPPII